jgi:hypothetical protein
MTSLACVRGVISPNRISPCPPAIARVHSPGMEAVAQFACEICGRKYKWKPALAGRKVKCACGEEIVCPAVAPADGDELYDFAEPQRPAPRAATAPSAPAAKPHAAPLQYQSPRTAAQTTDEYFPDKTIDFHLPLALIVGGTVIEVAAALVYGYRSPAGFTPHLTQLGLHLVVGTATMLVGVLIAARFRGIELGKLPTAVMKLAAVCIAPGAAVTLLIPAFAVIPFGWILALIGQFILYFALLGTLLKLDESDTWYCVCVIFIVNVALYFALMRF